MNCLRMITFGITKYEFISVFSENRVNNLK